MAKAANAKKLDPFKTKKTRTVLSESNDTITPPKEVARAIDSFRECQDQAKHFEGESTIHKDLIMNFSNNEYSKRLYNGMSKSFKILGDETMVTYVVMDSSAGLTEEDVEDFRKKWGKAAAEKLITRDFGSIKFDPKVLEANYDAVVEALQVLPEQVLDNLFKPMLMKASPGAVETAKEFVKTPEDIKDLIKQLKIKNYIR